MAKSKKALPYLQEAIKGEKDETARHEMQVAIENLQSGADSFGQGVRKLSREELEQAFAEAENKNGLYANVEEIAVSANRQDLERMEEIRLRAMKIFSDMGNKYFESWSQAIKFVRQRR